VVQNMICVPSSAVEQTLVSDHAELFKQTNICRILVTVCTVTYKRFHALNVHYAADGLLAAPDCITDCGSRPECSCSGMGRNDWM